MITFMPIRIILPQSICRVLCFNIILPNLSPRFHTAEIDKTRQSPGDQIPVPVALNMWANIWGQWQIHINH
ncbi:hypothetical protein ACJX0J_039921, partial [Zea mays]